MIHETEDDSPCSWKVFGFSQKTFLLFVRQRDETHIRNVLAVLQSCYFYIIAFNESDFLIIENARMYVHVAKTNKDT